MKDMGQGDSRGKALALLLALVPLSVRSAEVFNLEIARTYCWTVRDAKGDVVGAGRFRTADETPRFIRVPGVPNVRDLGGRIGLGGRRIRQGFVYRSAGWNDNATRTVITNGVAVVTNWTSGAFRLSPAVAELFVKPLGEFASCVLAKPAWELYGKAGLVHHGFPKVEHPLHAGNVGYHLRDGVHDITLSDWSNCLDFADGHGWSVARIAEGRGVVAAVL